MATRRVNLAAKSVLRKYQGYGLKQTTNGIVWVKGVQICNGTVERLMYG